MNGGKYSWESHKCNSKSPFILHLHYRHFLFYTRSLCLQYCQWYLIENNFEVNKTTLKKNFELLQVWFFENGKVQNPGKCRYLVITKDIANESIKLGKKALHAGVEQELLGIIIDYCLNFQNRTKSITK